LRASASADDPATRPCPSPQRPEAMAMPMPAQIGTQLGLPPPVDCAKAGTATSSTDNVMNKYFSVRILSPASVGIAVSGWLRLTVLAPSRSQRLPAGVEAVPGERACSIFAIPLEPAPNLS
jgi:hypothetical protein